MNEHQEHAITLVKKFLPMMYCFMGSGMLSNTYDEDVALENAKECAYLSLTEVLDSQPKNEDFYRRIWLEIKGITYETVK